MLQTLGLGNPAGSTSSKVMTLDSISQIGTSIAFLFVIADLIAQLLKLYKAKSSEEISLVGLTIRFLGVGLFWLRFMVIEDTVFLIGQTIFAVLLLVYVYLVIKYRKN